MTLFPGYIWHHQKGTGAERVGDGFASPPLWGIKKITPENLNDISAKNY